MKYRTTKKEVMNGNKFIIGIKYADVEYLLEGQHPAVYTCGVHGWNADVYTINHNTAVVIGSRPFGNISPDYSMIHKYDQKAKQAGTVEEIKAIFAEFVAECSATKWKDEERKIRKKLKLENLTATYYENFNDSMTLEFRLDGHLVWLRNVQEFDAADEFYWDDAKNVRRALKNAADDDFELVF